MNNELKKTAKRGHDDGYQAGHQFAQKLMQNPAIKNAISYMMRPLSLLNRGDQNNIAYLFAKELHDGNAQHKTGFFAYTHQPELNYFFGAKGKLQESKDTFLCHKRPSTPFRRASGQNPTLATDLPQLDQAILTNPQWQLHQYKNFTPIEVIAAELNKLPL
ncbi:MAG: hypothetical protein AAGA18_04195 [Verrucomicrobiota bacterium]